MAVPRSSGHSHHRLVMLGLAVVVVGLFGLGRAGAQAVDGEPTPSTFAESAGVPGSEDVGVPSVPSSTTPTESSDQVQLSELVKLGLLLMEPKGMSVPAASTGPLDPNPWAPPYKTGPAGLSPVVTPPPALGAGDGTVYAIGDSVLLGTESYLRSTLRGWDLRLDAKVSRRWPEGLEILRQNQASVGQVVVFCLGHNYGGGGFAQSYVDEAVALSARAQRVVFVTQTEWTKAQAEVNRAIYNAAARDPRIVVAPWAETIRANPGFLVDNVHPNRGGAIALANLIAVMVGPAPARTGVTPPRPVIMPIPDDPTPTPTPTAPPIGPSTTTVAPTTTKPEGHPTSTSPAPSSTSTSAVTSTSTPGPSSPPEGSGGP